ncbi:MULTISPECIES: ABC transporter permease [unclassified Rhizobium]|uniref:ABC transporter permease n=1 Tax=unclassified Rhizobium TaxID=2613769 RepID=UPI000714B833|nr:MULTISPECIES: ABC transporter permease [unclassified Rhizobium]KQS88665.1 sugar ABC transporter permease [Rhizobium sp. Leaf391]KQT05608.1 sugar ABC transporter permease [Rhizobium sp. Leaf386]KQT91332.1 sugar ABC transporter permease [Rhizobium sp. Leaf453]
MTTIETSSPPAVRSSRVNAAKLLSRYGTFAAFIALLIFNLIVTPNFVSWQTLNVNLTQVATIVIVAVGMTLVIATGGIDLSVGSLMAIAGAAAPMIFMGQLLPIENMGILIILSFILPILLVMAFGWFNGFLVTRFSIQPIVATLVLFIAGRGLAQVATNGNLQVFKNPDFQFIAMGRIAGIPAQVVVMIIVAILAHCLIRYTVIGRQIIAVGGNEKAARLTGIPVRRVKTFVYVISGALAGLAGLIVVARNSASDANLVGLGMELDAIAAVAVGGSLLTGGRANILGTVLGAFVIQLVRYTLLANGVPDAAALIVKAGLIIVAVFIQQRADKA